MDYYLYKLKFDGAVHFGQSESALSLYTTADHFRADTLFSALCHTALSLWGEDGVQALVKQAEADELLLSDSMPWRELAHEDVFYLPKPCAVSEKKREIPADLRKKMKRLLWIPVRIWADLNNLSAETHCINRRTKHSVSLPSERRCRLRKARMRRPIRSVRSDFIPIAGCISSSAFARKRRRNGWIG